MSRSESSDMNGSGIFVLLGGLLLTNLERSWGNRWAGETKQIEVMNDFQ